MRSVNETPRFSKNAHRSFNEHLFRSNDRSFKTPEEPTSSSSLPRQKLSRMEERMKRNDESCRSKERLESRNSSDSEMSFFHENDDFHYEDVETNTEVGETPATISRKTKFSSTMNTWNPSQLMINSCFDPSTGSLLSKANCEKNLADALKNKKKIDFYSLLQQGKSKETLSLSFALYFLDKLSNRSSIWKDDEIIRPEKPVFNLEKASEVDREERLPGGKRIRIAGLINPVMCSNWVGASAVSKAIVSILEKIKEKDPFFLIYSAPESERVTAYPPIRRTFFDAFSSILIRGFGIPETSKSAITMCSQVKQTTRNFIEKRRGSMRNEIEKILGSFVEKLNKDENFRVEERSLELDPPVFLPDRKIRKRKLPEEPFEVKSCSATKHSSSAHVIVDIKNERTCASQAGAVEETHQQFPMIKKEPVDANMSPSSPFSEPRSRPLRNSRRKNRK